MTTPDTATRRRRTGWRLVGYLARRATVMEIRGYQSIFRFLLRRPRVPPGARGFSYNQPVLGLLITFSVLSTVELVVVDLIVRRWEHIRVPLLIVGIWGLVFMFGLLFGMLTRPHAVGPGGIRIRAGAEVDIPLTWSDVADVRRRKIVLQDKQPKVSVDADGVATLHLRIQNETNLEVTLCRPMPLRLPHGIEVVSAVTCYADDPAGFIGEARRHLEARQSDEAGRPS